jgi:pimeloyl-ACP methyl ester carboxylesterase
MVKKTLLSLAIAASTAGLTACNISSTSDSNKVATDPINAGQPGFEASTTAVVFSPANGNIPVASDLLFANASATDGTADTADTSPPVTTAINDLAGFSATATMDIAFTASLDETTVAVGSSVWLIEMKSKEDNSLIDSLDLASIVAAESAYPYAEGDDQLVPGVDYTAEYVEMDNGATPTIRIHPLKPLDPKTKYIVVITDQLKGTDGKSVVASSEYAHVSGSDPLASSALAPVRDAVQAWEQLAGLFLNGATTGALTQENVILSHAFTTEANDEILLSMAAPENYISNLLADTVGLEGLLGEDTVALLVAGTAQALNAGNAGNPDWVEIDPSTPEGTLRARNTPEYKALVTSQVAQKIIGPGAAQGAADAIAAGSPTADPVNGAIAFWNGTVGNEEKQIPANPAEWTEDDYDNISRALGIYGDSTDTATYIALASNGAGALLKDAAHRPSAQDFVAIPGVVIPHAALGLTNTDAASMQGMLTLPQFMKVKSLADPSDLSSLSDFWKGSSSVGAVIDIAFGNAAGTTPPKDSDDSLNVTYRFPFAEHVEDVKVPVLVTYPTDGACVKPYKTIIFQHGITTDRTASIGFANQMAAVSAGCFATVAIDLPTHGVDASSSDRNGVAERYALFDTFNVAGYVVGDGSTTPFAATIAGTAPMFDGLAERHNNLALDATQSPVAMTFEPDADNGNAGTGNSGDFFINLTNMQQTRDHLRQATMDMMNLTASIDGMDIDTGGASDLDQDNLYFVGHSLGAITGLTSVAVNNTVANDAAITVKEVKPFKAAVLANPGGQLPKLLENSPTFSAAILPGLEAAAGLTQGMADLEKFFTVFQGPLDSTDPVNFTELFLATDTPVLMFEMVGGGLVNATDSNTDAGAGKVTGLPDTLIAAGGYPADTVVPNNANPALNDVATGKSYLTGTDPLIAQLELATVTASITMGADNLKVVSKLKEGTHGTISSADAVTVFSEMVLQTATFLQMDGKGLTVGDADQLAPAAE